MTLDDSRNHRRSPAEGESIWFDNRARQAQYRDMNCLGGFGNDRMVGRPDGVGCMLLVQKEGEDDAKGFGLPRSSE
jgi:hypothetical protein